MILTPPGLILEVHVSQNMSKEMPCKCAKIFSKKKIKKRFLIFWEVGEVRGVSIFRLGTVEEVDQISGWFEAGYETHRVLSYDLDTPSDALDNQIGPSVWPL